MHRDAHLSYKRYKFRELYFNGHPLYTSTNVHKTHCFCIFLIFQFLFLFLYEKQNKQHWNINNKNMLSKAIKLDWLKRKTKHLSYSKQKQEEREEVIESLGTLFLPHLRRTFPLSKPLNLWWGEIIETVQVWKEHKGFEKISKRSKRRLKLILASRCYHAFALLSGKPLIAI